MELHPRSITLSTKGLRVLVTILYQGWSDDAIRGIEMAILSSLNTYLEDRLFLCDVKMTLLDIDEQPRTRGDPACPRTGCATEVFSGRAEPPPDRFFAGTSVVRRFV
ncbi:hypothetical protein EVAR_81457_1 [Eumeta japonica]|uniref:Uncharacterized protein n=1 Tax=Eumeta variegata TaxID=151549 RepID=A0A4C1VXY7_EUMVA|nr:hypothetical protein EVAR_81457_1 [Eumeta japonica]